MKVYSFYHGAFKNNVFSHSGHSFAKLVSASRSFFNEVGVR